MKQGRFIFLCWKKLWGNIKNTVLLISLGDTEIWLSSGKQDKAHNWNLIKNKSKNLPHCIWKILPAQNGKRFITSQETCVIQLYERNIQRTFNNPQHIIMSTTSISVNLYGYYIGISHKNCAKILIRNNL